MDEFSVKTIAVWSFFSETCSNPPTSSENVIISFSVWKWFVLNRSKFGVNYTLSVMSVESNRIFFIPLEKGVSPTVEQTPSEAAFSQMMMLLRPFRETLRAPTCLRLTRAQTTQSRVPYTSKPYDTAAEPADRVGFRATLHMVHSSHRRDRLSMRKRVTCPLPMDDGP